MSCSSFQSRYITELIALLGFVAMFGAAGSACAQSVAGSLAPPAGNVPFLRLHAKGTQDYICFPDSSAIGRWVFERPEARLFVGDDALTGVDFAEHALLAVPGPMQKADPACIEAADGEQQYCPSWRSPRDGSTIWGAKVASETAGSAANCPVKGAIACLLVKAVAATGAQETHSSGIFGGVSFVQRLQTVGGMPPAGKCETGRSEQVPYSADYIFFRTR